MCVINLDAAMSLQWIQTFEQILEQDNGIINVPNM